MNDEKIKELAKQAGYLPDMFGVGHWDMPEFKRFAELIIEECAELVEDYVNEMSFYRADSQIKKNFGIE